MEQGGIAMDASIIRRIAIKLITSKSIRDENLPDDSPDLEIEKFIVLAEPGFLPQRCK